MADTVTLESGYFLTLLRKADFHASRQDLNSPVEVPMITIPKVDHDNLLQLVQDYYRLRDALYKGGIKEETLETLINGEQPSSYPLSDLSNEVKAGRQGFSRFSRPQGTKFMTTLPSYEHFNTGEPFGSKWQPSSMNTDGTGAFRGAHGNSSRQNSSISDEHAFSSTIDYDKDGNYLSTPRSERHHYEQVEQRTIVAKNLHEQTSLKDLTGVVRGGLLLDLWMKSNERTAFISFADGQHAVNFMNYVKRNDIIVKGKRIEWSWNDRQFFLPGHVAGKINIGATRNLVIRNCSPKISEEKIREDLDHIHNLIIIDVTFLQGDCFIALNSIHNALFARTCMMSRTAYKGLKIEWYEDECSWPLPSPNRPVKGIVSPPKKKTSPPMNRFQMLGLDGDDSEDAEDDAESDDATATTEMTKLSINARTPWDAASVVVA